METHCTYIPYSNTGAFTTLVEDYLQEKESLKSFYQYSPDASGLAKAIEDRSKYSVNRGVLVNVLRQQYAHLDTPEAVAKNITALEQEHTYTVCTAHQPNLLTGYLYFVYKILHAIKLADELNTQYKDKHFVPVYYMGSEDNDLQELGTFKYQNKKYTWDANGQQGAVGRMTTDSLKPVLDELFRVLGPPGEHTAQLKDMLIKAYLQQPTIGKATQYLVNELFGRYGLIVIDADDASLKREIFNILKDDLINHNAHNLVTEQAGKLAELYKAQAYPRPINLFYLSDGMRERIERDGNNWTVLNTDIKFTEEQLIQELDAHPERFSPNVILRGVFQESILPDVAFIGGGAEVAYWLQLKPVFDYYKVFYPVVLLRQSVLWIDAGAKKVQQQTGTSVPDLFKPIEELELEHIKQHGSEAWSNEKEKEEFKTIVKVLRYKAITLDPTLGPSADAALARINKQLNVLEKKMLRAEKRKQETALKRIEKLKNLLFPAGSLQERYSNFTEYYTEHGQDFLDRLLTHIEPLKNEFLVITV